MNSSARFALITGSSQGLGRAFAVACAERGWNLLLASLPGTGLPELADELRSRGSLRVEALEIDLRSEEGQSRLVAAALARPDRLGLLVNNVGIGHNGYFDLIPLAAQRAAIELNVLATTSLTHRLIPSLERTGGARILTVASLAGFYPMPLFAVYAATKAFLLHWSLALRHELAERGIGVTVLAPSGIYTNQACREKTKAQGLAGRLSTFEPDFVADFALDAAFRGRALAVPGLFNRLLMGLGSRLSKDGTARAIFGRWKSSLSRVGKTEDSAWFSRPDRAA